jgi:hypothetical protein
MRTTPLMSFWQYTHEKSARFGSLGFAFVIAFSVATLRRFGFRSKPPAPNAGGFAPDPIIVGGAFSNDPKRAAGRRASRSVRGTTRGAE